MKRDKQVNAHVTLLFIVGHGLIGRERSELHRLTTLKKAAEETVSIQAATFQCVAIQLNNTLQRWHHQATIALRQTSWQQKLKILLRRAVKQLIYEVVLDYGVMSVKHHIGILIAVIGNL